MKRIIPILFLMSCGSAELVDVDQQNKQEVNIEVGEPDGDYITHYKNGSVKLKGVIENGVRSGVWTSYYLNGSKASEDVYKNGELNGKTVAYFGNSLFPEYVLHRNGGGW